MCNNKENKMPKVRANSSYQYPVSNYPNPCLDQENPTIPEEPVVNVAHGIDEVKVEVITE